MYVLVVRPGGLSAVLTLFFYRRGRARARDVRSFHYFSNTRVKGCSWSVLPELPTVLLSFSPVVMHAASFSARLKRS